MRNEFLEELYKNEFKMLDLSKWQKDSDKHDDNDEPSDDESEEDEEDGFKKRQERKATDLTKYLQYVTASD